jgi:hypothetical protein
MNVERGIWRFKGDKEQSINALMCEIENLRSSD